MNSSSLDKASFPVALIAIAASVFSFFYFQSSAHPVYVDINKLMQGYERTKIVRAEFEAKAKTLNANVDSLLADWQDELKRYEKERSSMTEKELELQQELLANKQQQINNYQQAIQKQIQQEDQKSSQTLVNDINDFVKAYGEEHGYDIIFGANGQGNIMYASKGSDLTEEILTELNAQFKGK
jgi:outer membrane protein